MEPTALSPELKTALALAMGNTIVAKPSELTPLTANALAEVIRDVGLSLGVFNLVHGQAQKSAKPSSSN